MRKSCKFEQKKIKTTFQLRGRTSVSQLKSNYINKLKKLS